jgi:hypothetical protein
LEAQSLNTHSLNAKNQTSSINVRHLPRVTTNQSMLLPIGTQQKAMEAARLAELIEAPINRLLTVRTHALRITGSGGIFRMGSQADCIRLFLDKNMRWMKHRGIPNANIWSREHSSYHGEHFHIGFHQVDGFDEEYANQVAVWFDEEVGEWGQGGKLVAQSSENNWNINRCIRGGTSGANIAVYITKAEPSEIITGRGKAKPNERKPRRGKCGGTGPIEGNGKHAYRWGTSTLIGRAQRERHGHPH